MNGLVSFPGEKNTTPLTVDIGLYICALYNLFWYLYFQQIGELPDYFKINMVG